jgi:hypothetical protein
MHYKRAQGPSNADAPANTYVREALEKQAASRPPKSPPKPLPVTPTLPRVRKSKHRRRPG